MSKKPWVVTAVGRKGGVGKTTVISAMADELAHRGQHVLAIDFDPQGALTRVLMPPGFTPERTMDDAIYHYRVENALNAVVIESSWPGVELAPADEQLAARARDTGSVEGRLRRLLSSADLDRFDTVVIDVEPALGSLLVMPLVAAETAVVVSDCARHGISSIPRLIDVVRDVSADLNEHLHLGGIVGNQYDSRTSEHRFRREELCKLYGDQVLGVLPRRTAVETAAGSSLPPRKYAEAADFVATLAGIVDKLIERREEHG